MNRSNVDAIIREKNILLLVGCGHAHIVLLRRYRNFLPNTTVIAPKQFVYSGMIASWLCGQRTIPKISIDIQEECRLAGVKFLEGEVVKINHVDKDVTLDNGKQVTFDILSLNTGSKVVVPPSLESSRMVPIKPFYALEEAVSRLDSIVAKRRIAVIGAGATGIELALAFRKRYPALETKIQLIEESDRILPHFSDSVRKQTTKLLKQGFIEVYLNSRVTRIEDNLLYLDCGDELIIDYVFLASGLTAQYPEFIPARSALEKKGLFINKDLTLRGITNIFAVGDCAHFPDSRVYKVGVFPVRQAPVLADNIRRLLVEQPLLDFIPQKTVLQILNCGGRLGIATWGRFSWTSWLALSWKYLLDIKFLINFPHRKLFMKNADNLKLL